LICLQTPRAHQISDLI